MSIKWKSAQRFKPAVILSKIDAIRTVNPEGGASFSGFELDGYLPALQSMLQFPDAASEIDSSVLVWRGLTKVKGPLTPKEFLAAVNNEFSSLLASREERYKLLTTISLNPQDIPETVNILGARINFLKGEFSRNLLGSRNELIERHQVPIAKASLNYCRVVVILKAKSASAAVNKALRVLDLQRALWCLMGNPGMQISFGSSSFKPINVVRLGGRHTLHFPSGKSAIDSIWFDPAFIEAPIFRLSKPAVIRKNCFWALKRIAASKYKNELVSALVRYVRALDEPDSNTAFIRLWSALESLTTPGFADYDRLIRRCSFLFKENAYHRQILEHLREFRNESVHAGEQSEMARTLCYQVQRYFHALIWFHVRNAMFFSSLEEANAFLESPVDKNEIRRQIELARKAIKFID